MQVSKLARLVAVMFALRSDPIESLPSMTDLT